MKSENLIKLKSAGFKVPKFIIIQNLGNKDEFILRDINGKHIDLSFSDKSLFAVRSSCSVEDGEEVSFAGQFETKLNVEKDNIIDTVKEIFNGYYQSNIYNDWGVEKDIDNSTVIVQEMIDSDISGVLFTANPMGLLNESVVVVGKGLGCNVVDDKVNTTTYYYNVDDNLYYSEKEGNSVEITQKVLVELVEIGQKIEKLYNEKMDIEFAIKGDEIFILQARPITTLNEKDILILDNSNIVESYPGVSLPLTQSFVREIYYKIFRYCCLRVSEDEVLINSLDNYLRYMVDVANGRIYYRISNWYCLFKLLPFNSLYIPIWQQMLGVKNKSVVVDNVNVSFKVKYRIFKNIFKLLKNTPLQMEELNLFFKSEFENSREKLNELKNIDDILIFYEEFKEKIISNWDITLINDMYAFVYTALSGKKNKGLLADIKDLESLKPMIEVNNLIDIREEKGILSEDYKNTFDRYIDVYGDRCLSELKLETKTYRTNPELLEEYLKDRKKLDIIEKEISVKTKKKFVEKAKLGIYNREVSRMNRSRLFGLVRDIFLKVGEILVEQGRLITKTDVFYLFYDELKNTELNYIEIIEKRKVEYKDFENIPAYSRLVFSEKVVDKNSNIKDINVVSDKVLQGVGTSVGVVEGEVLIIENPDLEIDTTGKIIVTKMTDPGWVFLIRNSIGIIAEQGSLLSHTAIISRELKKPAVVNVKNALQVLHNGDKVRIDGLCGKIEILE